MNPGTQPEEQVLDTYSTGVERFGSTDLIVYMATSGDVQVLPRATSLAEFSDFLGDQGDSSTIVRQLARSAAAALGFPEGTPAFWLLVDLPGGEMICVAATADMVAASRAW
jgi:hypothetical protein